MAVLFLAACASTNGGEPASDVTTVSVAVPEAASTAPVGTGEPSASDGVGANAPTVTDIDVVVPDGFERTRALVTEADGSTCELCMWLADTAPQRSRGLMFVTDLGAADAMAFVYPEPHTGTFWMKNTVLPLSIAFFAPDGAFLSSFDMEPCTEPQCPNYRTADDFLVAVEVPQGGLGEFGLVAGSTLELLDLPCED